MKSLYTEDQIAARLEELAQEIIRDLGETFTMVPILTGGFIFAADLARALYRGGADPEIDFIQLASYGTARKSSGEIQLVKSVSTPVTGQSVLIVDDVLDTGRSVAFARQLFSEQGAAEIFSCVAVDKTNVTGRDFSADYRLFDLGESAFLVGYGMDDAGGHRGRPTIDVLDD